MTLSRRDLALLAAALTLPPTLAQAEPPQPLVIAHRGASGERPEETRLAYDLAIQEGADFIEPDLVPTKDGILVCRHENEISGTTDVASRPQFADRRATKTVDGHAVTGWFTEDFTLDELKTLNCRERLPDLRPNSAKFDGQGQILTFQEVIDIARAGSVRTSRTIGIYPEMKHPGYFASVGLPLEQLTADIIRSNGFNSPAAAMIVQCFEVGPLKTLQGLSRVRRMQLVDAEGGPADMPGQTYASMITPEGLASVKRYADILGAHQGLVLDLEAEPFPADTGLVSRAHAAGLAVHSWTARQENKFLPRRLQRGDNRRSDFDRRSGDVHGLLVALFTTRLDGVFSDFPALAVKARSDAMNLMARQAQPRR